jgi:hypothetical protein
MNRWQDWRKAEPAGRPGSLKPFQGIDFTDFSI